MTKDTDNKNVNRGRAHMLPHSHDCKLLCFTTAKQSSVLTQELTQQTDRVMVWWCFFNSSKFLLSSPLFPICNLSESFWAEVAGFTEPRGDSSGGQKNFLFLLTKAWPNYSSSPLSQTSFSLVLHHICPTCFWSVIIPAVHIWEEDSYVWLVFNRWWQQEGGMNIYVNISWYAVTDYWLWEK